MRPRRIAVAAILAVSGALYLWGSVSHAVRVNRDPTGWDQSVYLDTAMALRATGYAAVTNRNQMPLYPVYLSLFYTPSLEPGEFFDRAKAAGIGLSVVMLAIIFAALRRRLSVHAALNIFLITTFTVFVFKSPYCQPELLHYTLVFLAFLSMLDALRRPTLAAAARAGFFSALGWLTKASNLPGFLLFVIALAVRAVSARRAKDDAAARSSTRAALGAALVFGAVILPYAATSRRLFGSALYNVNSHFYVWHDSWGDAMAHARSLQERGLRPDQAPADERMGPARFLKTRGPAAAARRLALGSVETILVAAMSWGYFEYAAGYALLATALALWHRRKHGRWLPGPATVPAFSTAFLVLGFLACAFYVPIAPGPRFALAHFLPFIFVAASACERWGRGVEIPVRGRRVNALAGFNIFLSIVIALDIAQVLARNIFKVPGGG